MKEHSCSIPPGPRLHLPAPTLAAGVFGEKQPQSLGAQSPGLTCINACDPDARRRHGAGWRCRGDAARARAARGASRDGGTGEDIDATAGERRRAGTSDRERVDQGLPASGGCAAPAEDGCGGGQGAAAAPKKGRRERCTTAGGGDAEVPVHERRGRRAAGLHGDKYSGSEGAGDEDGGVVGCAWRWCCASAPLHKQGVGCVVATVSMRQRGDTFELSRSRVSRRRHGECRLHVLRTPVGRARGDKSGAGDEGGLGQALRMRLAVRGGRGLRAAGGSALEMVVVDGEVTGDMDGEKCQRRMLGVRVVALFRATVCRHLSSAWVWYSIRARRCSRAQHIRVRQKSACTEIEMNMKAQWQKGRHRRGIACADGCRIREARARGGEGKGENSPGGLSLSGGGLSAGEPQSKLSGTLGFEGSRGIEVEGRGSGTATWQR
ncbi:hypothetical protein B0H13DRAFT_2561306 [Mycena leptocephala]|nr:hypothetical protein B0H13DRAFT_2561306 [Mycena leptocephala]